MEQISETNRKGENKQQTSRRARSQHVIIHQVEPKLVTLQILAPLFVLRLSPIPFLLFSSK